MILNLVDVFGGDGSWNWIGDSVLSIMGFL